MPRSARTGAWLTYRPASLHVSFLARLPPQEVRRPFNRNFTAAGTKVR
jgi:hypothetical protein